MCVTCQVTLLFYCLSLLYQTIVESRVCARFSPLELFFFPTLSTPIERSDDAKLDADEHLYIGLHI